MTNEIKLLKEYIEYLQGKLNAYHWAHMDYKTWKERRGVIKGVTEQTAGKIAKELGGLREEAIKSGIR